MKTSNDERELKRPCNIHLPLVSWKRAWPPVQNNEKKNSLGWGVQKKPGPPVHVSHNQVAPLQECLLSWSFKAATAAACKPTSSHGSYSGTAEALLAQAAQDWTATQLSSFKLQPQNLNFTRKCKFCVQIILYGLRKYTNISTGISFRLQAFVLNCSQSTRIQS